MSRSLPALLVFRVRFDRDHEAWRSCVCHSMTPGPKDRSATPPRTCTLQLCSSCKTAPLRSGVSLARRARPTLALATLSPLLSSPRLLSLALSLFAKRVRAAGTGQWNEHSFLATYRRCT